MDNKILQTKTELHTHLIGMLSAESFIEFLKDNGLEYLYWPLDKPVDENSKFISFDEILSNHELYYEFMNKIQIKRKTKTKYEESLNSYYITRSELIKYIIEIQKDSADNISSVKKRIYNDYINRSLNELIKQGVEYVEISYSNRQVLKDFKLDDDIKDKIKCCFLLSTDRSRKLKEFKRSSKDLKQLIEQDLSVGFDIMGEEREFSIEELDYSDSSKNSRSFKRKLEVIIEMMNNHENTTLRIHSGETINGFNNTELVLEMIEEISEERNIIIPPPEIRIGHGIHFENNENYIRLLKKFYCIIEINATSNYALSNIEVYSQIPYRFYLENGIPIVISTDGHGLYDTEIGIEDEIARTNIGDELYSFVTDIDSIILNSKTGGKNGK